MRTNSQRSIDGIFYHASSHVQCSLDIECQRPEMMTWQKQIHVLQMPCNHFIENRHFLNERKAYIKIKFVGPLLTDPKISSRLKRFYWKKVLGFFYWSRPFIVLLFIVYLPRKCVRNLEINAISRQLFCLLVSLALDL